MTRKSQERSRAGRAVPGHDDATRTNAYRVGTDPVLQLQRMAGNQAVGEALGEGGEADCAEREAELMAERALRSPFSAGPAAGAFFPSARGGTTPPREALDAVQAEGRPMDPDVLHRMEGAFHTEFSQVRVHTGTDAARAASATGAAAFTIGPHVAFASGRYEPGTAAGTRLLVHELSHVMQQAAGGPTLQCSPDDKPKTTKKEEVVDRGLPWTHGDYSLFEATSSGILFLVAIAGMEEATIRAAIPDIGKRMAGDNKVFKDPAQRVTTCIIANTTTRFARWKGTPVLMLDPSDAELPTAAHEMGHAEFAYLKGRAASKEKDAAGAANSRLQVGDIYVRLSATKPVTFKDQEVAAGLWIADPSQWSTGGELEHPWQDPDEFFASAKEAFQINRKGFEAAIARLTKVDPAVGPPAKELIRLLEAFLGQGKLPAKSSLSKERRASAEEALERETGVTKVEETVRPDTPLDWLLNPEHRPKKQTPGPSIKSPY